MKRWRVTAEHCNGKSVCHHCKGGVYEDPASTYEEIIEAPTADMATERAFDDLVRIVAACEECSCDRHLAPGSNSWWKSVAIHAEVVP